MSQHTITPGWKNRLIEVDPTRPPLTPRQKQFLDYVARFILDNGLPPTSREIGKDLGVTSPNGVGSVLDALIKKGYLTRIPGAARGIRLVVSDNRCPCCGQTLPPPQETAKP